MIMFVGVPPQYNRPQHFSFRLPTITSTKHGSAWCNHSMGVRCGQIARQHEALQGGNGRVEVGNDASGNLVSLIIG